MIYTTEDAVLQSIHAFFPNTQDCSDDCAFLPKGEYSVSVDSVSEGLDFRCSTFTPYAIGYKALAVNISDILSSGAVPKYFLLALSLAHNTQKHFFEEVMEGMSALAQEYSIQLIGGDISFEETLRCTITIFGTPITQPIQRGKAHSGDIIFYIPPSENPHPLGLARTGYLALEEGSTSYPKAVAMQQKPPLVNICILSILSQYAEYISLMDISDGLLQDIPRLLHSPRTHLCATLNISESLLHPEVMLWCKEHKSNPIHHALIGGEEYCLLGTAPEAIYTQLLQNIPQCVAIGTVIEGENICCNGENIK